jgi:CheY-like chemotaxis protein
VQVADSTPAPVGIASLAEATAAEVDAAKIRVLLAEDNLVNQKVSVFMLERLGCQVELAINGQLAVEAAARHGYDLILMDMRMPDMDGLEATRAIRAGYGPNKGTPIVAMTANTMAEDRDTCLEAGMNDFLGKPILLDRLKDCLSRWVKVASTDSDRGTAASPPAIG